MTESAGTRPDRGLPGSVPQDLASRRNYASTFITEGVVLLSALLVYRIVAQGFGPEGFAAYALARRALTLFVPFGVLGLDVAIARFAALALARGSGTASVYVLAGLSIAAIATGVTSAVLIVLRDPLTELIFGSPVPVYLTTTLPVLLTGATLHVVSYSSLRGFGRIGRANLLMTANHGLLPVAVVLATRESLPQLLTMLGIGWTLISLLSLLAIPMSAGGVRSRSEELLGFGLRRAPGDFVQLLFFALPAILVAHVGTLQEAGVVALAISALGMVGSGITPISFVLLPLAAGMFGRSSLDELRGHVIRVARVILPLLLIGVVLIELFAEPALVLYLGPEFASGAGVLRIVMLGALPWGLYVMLKSVLDARYVAAVNARNLAISFGILALAGLPALVLSTGTTGVLSAFVLGLYVLGILTVIEVRRSLQ
jgi:O-antigen/teichoic acid export membrane protein